MAADPGARTAAYTGVRPEILAAVPDDSVAVLDVGCADGSLGAALRQRPGVSVTGIEADPGLASRARERLDEVLAVDLDDLEAVRTALAGRSFDCLVVADVLEHLRDPWATLEVLTASLAPGGRAVLSVPNVGHVSTLWSVVVRGTWPRRERGLHDSTHLRWFGRNDLDDLVRAGGLRTLEVRPTYRFVDRPTPRNAAARRVAVPGLRRLLAYQFVVLADRPPGP